MVEETRRDAKIRFDPREWRLGLPRTDVAHLGFVSALVAAGVIAFWRILEIKPYDADNLIGFTIGARSTPWQLFRSTFVSYIPGYRPLGYLTIWIEHELFGWAFWAYYLVNLALWIAVSVATYALLSRITQNAAAAALFAFLTLVDTRIQPALFWVTERQLTLAVLFGLCALLVAWRARPLGPLELAGVATLTLCAGLSKEYGLAFILPLLWLAKQLGRRGGISLAAAALAGAAAYGSMRLVFAGGATAQYCEDIGVGRAHRMLCYSDLTLSHRVGQYVWNIGAGFAGTAFPPLFEPHGAFAPLVSIQLLAGVVVAGFSIYGLVRLPRQAVPMLALFVGNSLLSLMIYRTRNQAVGMVAFYCLGAIGFAEFARARAYGQLLAARAVVLSGVALLGFALWMTARDSRELASRVRALSMTDACDSLAHYPHDIDRSVVDEIKRATGQIGAPCR